jgi:hypothetical protein
MSYDPSSTAKSSCTYPIVIMEHTFRGSLYGALAGLVFCSRPRYFYKVAKVTVLGGLWAYLAEYSRCSFNEVLPWTSTDVKTAWIPGALAGVIAGSTAATSYRPILPASQVAAFTAFSTVTYAMSGLAEWYAAFEAAEQSRKAHPHLHAWRHSE